LYFAEDHREAAHYARQKGILQVMEKVEWHFAASIAEGSQNSFFTKVFMQKDLSL